MALSTGDEAPSEAAQAVLETVARKLAMHVTAARPKYVSSDAVPEAVIAGERTLLLEQVRLPNPNPYATAHCYVSRVRARAHSRAHTCACARATQRHEW